ncbi:hypothetical protein Trydic_g13318, partial [Trypoxylus dichotomus]
KKKRTNKKISIMTDRYRNFTATIHGDDRRAILDRWRETVDWTGRKRKTGDDERRSGVRRSIGRRRHIAVYVVVVDIRDIAASSHAAAVSRFGDVNTAAAVSAYDAKTDVALDAKPDVPIDAKPDAVRRRKCNGSERRRKRRSSSSDAGTTREAISRGDREDRNVRRSDADGGGQRPGMNVDHSYADRSAYGREYVTDFRTVRVLIGRTGLGKTEYALAHFRQPLHVRDDEDWRRLTRRTDGIVLDDLDFRKWSPAT